MENCANVDDMVEIFSHKTKPALDEAAPFKLNGECLDQDLVGRIQIKPPPTNVSLASWFWCQP